MAQDPFSKVSTGDPLRFTSQWFNAVTDAAKAFQGKGGFSASALSQSRSSTIIKVRNDTGLALDRNSVIGLAGPVFKPWDDEDAFLREIIFSAVPPTGTSTNRFAVLLEPSPAPDIYGQSPVTRAIVAGVCAVKVEVMDDSHKYANVIGGETGHMKSTGIGAAQILWSEWEDSDSGYGYDDEIQWAIVLLGGSVSKGRFAVGKASGAIPARTGASYGGGYVALFKGPLGHETASGETVAVLNACGDTSPSGAISDGKYVSVGWDEDGVAWVGPLECG